MSNNSKLTKQLLEIVYPDLPNWSNKKLKKLLKITKRKVKEKIEEHKLEKSSAEIVEELRADDLREYGVNDDEKDPV